MTYEWLSNLSRNFESIVLGGMSASLWDEVTKTLSNNGELKGKQNQAVINSVNHHLFQFIGRQRPESSLSRYVYLPGGNYFLNSFLREIAEILRKKLPSTFGCIETVRSEQYGILPVKNRKGKEEQAIYQLE